MTDKDNITLPREVVQLALDALHYAARPPARDDLYAKEIAILRTALAAEQPKQQPVGWMESPHGAIRANPNYRLNFPSQLLHWQIPLYTASPDIEALRREDV